MSTANWADMEDQSTPKTFVKFGRALTFKNYGISREIIPMELPETENREEPRQNLIFIPKPEDFKKYESQSISTDQTDQDPDWINTTTTLRVSNIARTVEEAELRDLFSIFGTVIKLNVPRENREQREPGEHVPHRGNVFVSYETREQAVLATKSLHRRGLANMILTVEWARPNNNPPGGGGFGGGATRYTGYGRQLAQDTNEEAIFFAQR